MENKYSYKTYDTSYPRIFEQEKHRLEQQLIDTRIEHFGSSAVPNLGGKGIIDIYVVTNKNKVQNAFQILQEKLDYEFRPGGGDEHRFFFRRHDNNQLYHLHLSDDENPNFEQSIVLLDYLKNHPDDAARYDEIKRKASELAMQSDDYEKQKEVYQQTKANLIAELNKKAIG